LCVCAPPCVRACARVCVRACVRAYMCVFVCACVRAGAMWRSRTMTAPWAAREGHTTVVDAAGAIYVIGGSSYNGTYTYFHDVWASTDGGARPDSRRGGGRGVLKGVLQGEYSRGSLGIPTGFAPGRPTRARISDRSPVPLSLRRSTCTCSRRCHYVYGVHGSRTRTVCALSRAVARARVSADACACVCLCVRARACVHVCVGVCVCVRVRARVCVCVRARECVCSRLLVWLCARACAAALCAPSHRTAVACGINSSARAARCGRARAVAFGATGRL
jgi:hypothetical protein